MICRKRESHTMSEETYAWSVRETHPPHVDVIALVSFGANEYGLTNGTKQVVKLGLEAQKKYPNARVVFGEFTGNNIFDYEHQIKMKFFPDALYADRVISTIKEALAWRHAVRNMIFLQNILIITDEMHSRSARRVSNRVFNGVWFTRLFKKLTGKHLIRIHVKTFATEDNIDLDNPMTNLRDKQKWFNANVSRELFLTLCPFGYTIMRVLNIHQPTSK